MTANLVICVRVYSYILNKLYFNYMQYILIYVIIYFIAPFSDYDIKLTAIKIKFRCGLNELI